MTTLAIGARHVLAERDGRHVLLDNAWVHIDGAHIEAVCHDRPAAGVTCIEHEHGLVLPGFINLHTHAMNGALYRGIPDDLPFDPWVTELIYKVLMPLGRVAARVLSPEDLKAAMTLGVIDLLKGGTTTFMDSWHPGQAVFFEVVREVGIRAIAAPYLMSTRELGMGDDGLPAYTFGADWESALDRSVALFREHQGDGRVQVALGPHGADTCEPDLLHAVRRTADDLGCLVTTHLAQTPEELAFLRRRYDKGPVEYLDDAGLIGDGVVLAHCVYATDAEIARLAESGAAVANCAVSFAREGTNVPYSRFAEAGVLTGIGTDSHGMDFVSELRTAGFFSKLHFASAGVASAHELVHAGTLSGAEAIRRPDLGRLAPGARADLQVVDLRRTHLQPVFDPVKNLVWKGSGRDIVSIFVDGQELVRDGRMTTVDEEAVMTAAAVAAQKMWAAAEAEGILQLRAEAAAT